MMSRSPPNQERLGSASSSSSTWEVPPSSVPPTARLSTQKCTSVRCPAVDQVASWPKPSTALALLLKPLTPPDSTVRPWAP